MVRLEGYNVQVSRGDTLALRIRLAGASLPEGTLALFTVRGNPQDKESLMQKEYEPGTDGLVAVGMTSTETSLPAGAYWWDLRVVIPREGAEPVVITPFAPAQFKIVEVVGDVSKWQ